MESDEVEIKATRKFQAPAINVGPRPNSLSASQAQLKISASNHP
jgi:hypothetical protein